MKLVLQKSKQAKARMDFKGKRVGLTKWNSVLLSNRNLKCLDCNTTTQLLINTQVKTGNFVRPKWLGLIRLT